MPAIPIGTWGTGKPVPQRFNTWANGCASQRLWNFTARTVSGTKLSSDHVKDVKAQDILSQLPRGSYELYIHKRVLLACHRQPDPVTDHWYIVSPALQEARK